MPCQQQATVTLMGNRQLLITTGFWWVFLKTDPVHLAEKDKIELIQSHSNSLNSFA